MQRCCQKYTKNALKSQGFMTFIAGRQVNHVRFGLPAGSVQLRNERSWSGDHATPVEDCEDLNGVLPSVTSVFVSHTKNGICAFVKRGDSSVWKKTKNQIGNFGAELRWG